MSWRHKLIIIINTIFLLIGTKQLLCQVSLEEFVKKAEVQINSAAECWLDRKYARAIDILQKVNESISDNSFPPTDRFAWQTCRCIKTYSIVFSRVIESKRKENQGELNNAEELKKQAKKWASILESQAYSWSKIPVQTSENIAFRRKWLQRFLSIITAVNRETKTYYFKHKVK